MANRNVTVMVLLQGWPDEYVIWRGGGKVNFH